MKRTITAEVDNWDVVDAEKGKHTLQVRVHFKVPHGKTGTKDIWKWVNL